MQIPQKILKNGFSMPVYGLGTWTMGGRETHDPNNNDEKDIQAIQTAIDNGVFHIDSAESYADGYAEVLVGKAIEKYDRSKLFLTSKVHLEHLSYDGVIHAAKESLKRMNVKYLDLYYTHRYSLDVPIEETMRAMNTLLEEGLIKNIGISNYNLEETQKAVAVSKHKIVATQLHLNLKYREAERKGLLKYCQENDMLFVAWRPLQKGVLLENEGNLVDELAKKYSKTPAQIALNWLISQENVVTLSKTESKEHLLDNIGAVGWQMETEDVQKLDKEYPNQEDVSDTVPLH